MPLSRALTPSFQELVAFEAASRHMSFTRAAEELSLTQSAVSKQVRQLEVTLGIVLFNRVKSRVILTALGEQYIRSVRRILSEYETATHAVIAASGSEATLKIAVLPTFASRWLIPRLPSFLADHPSVTVNIVSELEPFEFAEKPVDVAIHYGSSNWPQADVTFLCDEVIIAVMSPSYGAANSVHHSEDLRRAVLLQQATRPNLWAHWFNTVGVEHPFPYRGPMFDQFSMTSQAATAGLGVALVPIFMVQDELERGVLARLEHHSLPGPGAYYAATPLRNRLNPLVSGFVRWMVDEAQRDDSIYLASGRD
jgi:LysR family glycine cleavage system transcriptional activator